MGLRVGGDGRGGAKMSGVGPDVLFAEIDPRQHRGLGQFGQTLLQLMHHFRVLGSHVAVFTGIRGQVEQAPMVFAHVHVGFLGGWFRALDGERRVVPSFRGWWVPIGHVVQQVGVFDQFPFLAAQGLGGQQRSSGLCGNENFSSLAGFVQGQRVPIGDSVPVNEWPFVVFQHQRDEKPGQR